MPVVEKVPDPISKLVSMYNSSDEQPQVDFRTKIYYYSISPQIQLGVTGYSRLLDLANIQINADDETAKKVIEDWIDSNDFRTKLDAMGNTLLICGNSLLEKLSDKDTQDVAEVDMKTIVSKKRDSVGKTLYYMQQADGGPKPLGETQLNRFIEFNLNTISRDTWSPCIFESAAIPRKVGNRLTLPLVELVVGLEDAMSTIILNNAYPEVYYTFEGANEEQLRKEQEKIRKKKPGDRMLVTKKPQIDLFEAKGQSAYVDYIKYLYNSLSASIKFPIDIINGDFTSRASSETSADLPEQIASSIKRYIGSKLKSELFDPILAQNKIVPKDANLQVTFGITETIPLLPTDIITMAQNNIITTEESREWFKDNTGMDLFDDDKIEDDVAMADQVKDDNIKGKDDNMIPVPQKDGSVIMKPSKVTVNKEKVKEGFGDTIIYKLEYSHNKTDECDDYSDEVFEADSPDMPVLPLHPNCKCYYEDDETGEYLGQDPQSALGGNTMFPESFKEADDDTEWITINGVHVPVKSGQSKDDAAKDFIDGKLGKGKPDLKNSLKQRGLKGDDLLNNIDKAKELKDNKATVNDDGTVTVYHHTSKDAKDSIMKTGNMKGAEDGIFFTTKKDGQASGFGDSVITAKIPLEKLDLDDTFGDEVHLRIPTERRGQSVDVSKFLDKESYNRKCTMCKESQHALCTNRKWCKCKESHSG